MNASKNGKPT
jgi:hypothetical protein